MAFFKVRLLIQGSSIEICAPIRAESIGEAIVKADERSLNLPLGLCDNPAIEITEEEYHQLMREPLGMCLKRRK